MKVDIATSGNRIATLEPSDEKNVRAVLESGEAYPESELSYYLDHLLSDVDLFIDLVVMEDDGTVLFEGAL